MFRAVSRLFLAIDVGNTNTVFALWDGARFDHLIGSYRIETSRSRPGDEYAALLSTYFAMDPALAGRSLRDIEAAAVVSVVPQTRFPVEQACQRWIGTAPLEAGKELALGMPILTDHPEAVGVDRIVNAICAHEEHRQGLIVIDMGTATTFDVVSPAGEYLGGAIAPGLGLSADELIAAAAKLPRVVIAAPPTAIGKNTVHAMQSGLYHGYVGLVDHVTEKITAELSFVPKVIATGGLAPLIARESKTIQASDEMLTLRGLAILYRRRKGVG